MLKLLAQSLAMAGITTLLFLSQAQADTKYVSETILPTFFNELTQSPVAVKAMKVIDPLTFMGEDKNIYALSGIEVPNLQTGKADITLEASKKLAELIEGKDLKLYVTKSKDKGRLNRMNQSLVQVELKQEHIWIEGELLAEGLARVRTTPSNPEMANKMLEIEAKAREAKKGLWGDSHLQILTPETAIGQENSFAVVEGTPKAASVTRNMIFINFSDDYKTDFTVGIPSNLRIAFSRRGIDPLQLGHTKMRVRGWLQSYNGPFIEIDHPEQIEILGKMSALTSSPTTNSSANSAGMHTISMPKPPVVAAPQEPEVTPQRKHVSEPNP